MEGNIIFMQITQTSNNQAFGRAFTTKEKQDYKKLISDARKELNIEDTSAIVFDFNVPSEKGFNPGIGTSFSDAMLEFTDFLKDMVGINSIQLGPQGKINYENTSPYSGTNFALGEHLIDFKKLTTPEYINMLKEKDLKEALKNYPGDEKLKEYRTDYTYTLGADNKIGIYEKVLKKAFTGYLYPISIFDIEGMKFNYEFECFVKDNSDWLEPEILFQALTEEYGTDDINCWEDEDKYLYSKERTEKIKNSYQRKKYEIQRKKRIKKIKNEYKQMFEFESFKLFIANKQQQHAKKDLNAKDIKIYGDGLFGFSRSEVWANIDCFNLDLFYGGPDDNCSETNNIQTWGLNAIDYNKIGKLGENEDISSLGAAGKLLYKKYKKFFERYDGLRIDAAWQFVTPFVYKEEDGNYEYVKQRDFGNNILDIIKKAAKDAQGEKYSDDNIHLELVGYSSKRGKELTKNIYPHLFTTAYSLKSDETPAKYSKQGFKPDKFYAGVANHDDDTIISMSKDEDKRINEIIELADDYQINFPQAIYNSENYIKSKSKRKQEEYYRIMKFAEIFTAPKQFFTLTDMFGMNKRINISGKKSSNNWTIRIPSDYESFYYSQLSKGLGLNVPKSLQYALYMKHAGNKDLMDKLSEAAEILRENGPYTEKEANEEEIRGKLKHKFSYDA